MGERTEWKFKLLLYFSKIKQNEERTRKLEWNAITGADVFCLISKRIFAAKK